MYFNTLLHTLATAVDLVIAAAVLSAVLKMPRMCNAVPTGPEYLEQGPPHEFLQAERMHMQVDSGLGF